MVNCTVEPPYAEDFMKGMGPVALGCTAVLSLMTLVTCALFVELWVYLNKNVNSTTVRDRCLIVLGLLPAISIVSQLGMIVPRAAMLAELITSISTGWALFAFFHLTLAYLGGEVEMLSQTQRMDSVLSVTPFCCCCICLPRIRISRRVYKVFYICISQTVFLLPIMHFIVVVLWADGKYFREKVKAHNPMFYLGIAGSISTLLSLYVFNILMRTGLHIADKTYNLLPKYVIFMVVVLINNLQPLLIEVLTAYNVIPCTEMFSWIGRGSVFNHMGTVAEAFILMLLSRRFYRKPYPPVETLSFIPTLFCSQDQ